MSLQPTDYAWMTVGGVVVGWNIFCKDGCTLSERADDYVLSHRWLVRGIAYTLTAHVTNTIPNRMDPVHWGFVGVRKLRKIHRRL